MTVMYCCTRTITQTADLCTTVGVSVLLNYAPGKALQLGQCLTSIDEEPTDIVTSNDDTAVIGTEKSDTATTATASDSTNVDLVGDYYLALRDDGSVVICRGTPLQGNRKLQL
jgi:hypothetical protein